jgi:hypothetical protein
MVTGGRGVTIRLVLLVGSVTTALSYLAFRIWTVRGGGLSPSSWGALIVLVFMACGVFFAGLPVRRFLHGQAKKPLSPIRAMRTLVLAQAAALTGALVTGWYVAQVLVLLPTFDIASRRSLLWEMAALAAGGVLMAVAGMLVQRMCRVGNDRPGRDDDRDVGRRSNHSHER